MIACKMRDCKIFKKNEYKRYDGKQENKFGILFQTFLVVFIWEWVFHKGWSMSFYVNYSLRNLQK